MRRLGIVVAVLVGAGMIATEAAMKPTAADRVALYGIFGAVTLATVVAGWWLRSRARRFRSLGVALRVVAVSSVVVAASAVGISAMSMFLNTHDLRLVLVALGLGVGLGLVLAVSVTGSITSDLERLKMSVDAVGRGDLTVRTGIVRPDEIGDAAGAVDDMIARLESAERTRRQDDASRKEFLAAVSHDLRTPLATLRAGLEALEDGMVDDPGRLYKVMGRDIDALGRLIDDLSVLATVEAGGINRERVDLAELADDTVEAMASIAGRNGVRLVVESAPDVVVSADPGAVSRLLRNLVDNALRHAPHESIVRLEIDSANGTATVVVSDEGPGFSEEFRPVAFERFTRHDPARSGEGSGLGLAIARGIVEAHGGEIWIGDGPGGEVAFRLPGAATGLLA
ncbi:MAG: HAMP domain-containing histidine kinase [Acidimicrobiia bacterium]|nr:HAMP domain-containing histidine kinase [Acidimicrobiia bacterium]